MKRIWQADGRFWYDLFRLACHLLTLAIFMSFLGSVLPVGDSLAVFRIEFTALLALCGGIAVYLKRSMIPMMAAMTVAVSVISILPFAGQGATVQERDFRLHQHNVLFGNKELDLLIAKVGQLEADILTFQEINETNFAHMRAGLEAAFPHFQVCLYSQGGVAVMMRDLGPLLDYGCVAKGRLAWMRVGTPVGPVTVVSMHQLWPWPKGQFWQKEVLSRDIAALPRPVLLAGDFNNVPWSAAVRSAAQAAGGRVARGLGRSYLFDAPWPRFRIDHVVVPIEAEVSAVLTPGWGSDHLGITADIRLHRHAD